MAIKIYGDKAIAGTQIVTVVLRELGVPYEVVPVDMANGAHKGADWIAGMHPFGQTPVLVDDDGFKLYESRAIGRYLARKHGAKGLYPVNDLKKAALFEQAASIEQHNFHIFAYGIVTECIAKKLHGEQKDEERTKQLITTLEKNLAVYDVILGKTKYLAGDQVTLADLFHLPFGYVLDTYLGFKGLRATPNIARWWSDLTSRDAWKAILVEAEGSKTKLPPL